MSRIHGSLSKAALTGIFALGMTSAALAQTAAPTSGLGQSWPNATDVSASPQWHVYVFVLNGVKYVQVNDLNGTVHAAIGTTGSTTIVLPVGVDAHNVLTPTASNTSSNAVTVYNDGATTVTATPQSNGATLFNATTSTLCQGGYSCGGGRGP